MSRAFARRPGDTDPKGTTLALALRQAARTAREPYPERPLGTPYAFAIELRELGTATVAVVRCPWCGDQEAHHEPDDQEPRHCFSSPRALYVVAVPAGTPVMVPTQ